MSYISPYRNHYNTKNLEICIGNISNYTEPNVLLTHFEKFGEILQYNFTSPTGGYVFITYKDRSMVDECMNSRPHNLDGRNLYVKRALPTDDEHPRERFETTRDLMIVIDFDTENCDKEEFLKELRAYFSSYGQLYACKYCHETNFDYILVEFADKDQVDRIILDKPHYYYDHQLHVMKSLESNIDIMNKKCSSKKQGKLIVKDAIDDDENYDSIKSQNNIDKNNSIAKEPISEIDLENEVYRLQNVLKQMNEEFTLKRRQLEDDCCEKLKQLNESSDKTHHLQQDLEQEHEKLLAEIESVKRENEELNEQYLAAELENFEITSYYEQILAEEKATTAQLEAEYTQKLKALHTNHPSPPNVTPSSPKSPLLSTVPNDI